MRSSLKNKSNKSSPIQSVLTGQNIVYGGIAWAVGSLLFFLLFSVTIPGEDRFGYLFGTYILECVPFIAAALLCYRNWGSPEIPSGRNVWLGIGMGMLAYSIANVIFGVWELHFHLDPDVSPADLFYLISYISIGWGMVLAVLPRRLNLEMWQWGTVGAIAAVGIALAIWILFAAPVADDSASEALETAKNLPAWVVTTDNILSPLSRSVNFLYIVLDVCLLILASTLLLAFWGGRFAQSWRMIAAATLSLYIADMGFKYADAIAQAKGQEYESGGLLDVFFIFSAVLFAIGAALEYDVSSRSRRSSRRRT
ncbi:MAG TPA: hypothetical protein DEG17_13015 [Cyanobacteria bacterium UBA11149]|nr:hypothetical protein [Cyanobacteria bacterium UBA11367]HBE60950.1 hypothetical protein [Cyanobacteria bacterium UBA11366]HBK62453.1 hypothetical protein [Cyanobacteria bacterium UBA11166]HBR76412.1 hypothetical protein [Cyanobacteria bacterium UBA11159]HBS72067.1 hypothetical protein [Cyanobacteria bacterium UBA11153]HBW89762.1 hypothetical protein [Cyanobacteria bacterium UBA11149]HCA95480.1 hypothetical protein [Cyanobacteria bacterium UBA9226]